MSKFSKTSLLFSVFSLSSSLRNWLLLSDVLGRLRMTSRSFRRLFPQLNVQSIPEDEFYRQASLSQLLTGPDEQELASFRPDVKDPLELVEATPELAGMLGSSLEFVDTRWDTLEGSPPPTPPPPPTPRPPPSQRLLLRPPQRIPPLLPPQRQGATEAGAKVDITFQNKSTDSGQFQGPKTLGFSTPAAKMETKIDASMWEPQQLGSKNAGVPIPVKPNVTMNANVWELQRQQSKNIAIAIPANSNSKVDSSMWEPQRQQRKNIAIVKSVDQDSKIDSNAWERQRQPSKNITSVNSVSSYSNIDSSLWEPQRHQSKKTWISNSANTDSQIVSGLWEQQRQPSKETGIASSANPDSKSNWEQQLHEDKPTRNIPVRPDVAVGAAMWEPQRLRSRSAVNSDTKEEPAQSEPQQIQSKNSANSENTNGTLDANMWKRLNQGSKTSRVLDSTNPGASAEGRVCAPQQLRSKNSEITSASVDANTWECQGTKRAGGTSAAPKRDASPGDNQGHGAKTIKMDAAWQRNLGNVRVHIRDLGIKVGGTIRRDVKKEQVKAAGKGARVKTRS